MKAFLLSNAGCILFRGHFRFFFSFIHEFVMRCQSQYQSGGKLFAGAKTGDIRVYQDKMINGSGKK